MAPQMSRRFLNLLAIVFLLFGVAVATEQCVGENCINKEEVVTADAEKVTTSEETVAERAPVVEETKVEAEDVKETVEEVVTDTVEKVEEEKKEVVEPVEEKVAEVPPPAEEEIVEEEIVKEEPKEEKKEVDEEKPIEVPVTETEVVVEANGDVKPKVEAAEPKVEKAEQKKAEPKAEAIEEDPKCPSREFIIKCSAEFLDTNKNGLLERSELQSAIDSLPWYGRSILNILGSVDKMMKKCDLDGDDAISMEYDMTNNKETCLATCFKRLAFYKSFFPECKP